MRLRLQGMAALEHRYRVVDDGLAGLGRHPLDEEPDEGPGLGQLAGSQELAPVASERAGTVEEYTARKPVPPSVTTSATWGIDTSFRYLGLAKTPMASGWLADTVFQASFGFDPV